MIAGGQWWIEYKSRSDVFRLWALGDLHLGHRNCAEKDLKGDLKAIVADSHALWIGMGDYADYVGYRDKRFDPDAMAEQVKVRDLGRLGKVLTEQVRDLFMPIKDKCIGLLMGNHERHYQVAQEQEDLHTWLCKELGTRNLGYSCFLDLTFCRNPRSKTLYALQATSPAEDHDRWSRRIFAHHGAGFAQTPGGKLNRLIAFMDYFESDITICAHVHDSEAKRLARLGADTKCQQIVDHEQLGVVTGSYLRTYGEGAAPSYAEQRGYRPVPLCAAAIDLVPDKHEMRVMV